MQCRGRSHEYVDGSPKHPRPLASPSASPHICGCTCCKNNRTTQPPAEPDWYGVSCKQGKSEIQAASEGACRRHTCGSAPRNPPSARGRLLGRRAWCGPLGTCRPGCQTSAAGGDRLPGSASPLHAHPLWPTTNSVSEIAVDKNNCDGLRWRSQQFPSPRLILGA
jgi:hypothetical protein